MVRLSEYTILSFLQESECYRKYTRKELENFLTCGGFDVIAGDNYILLRCDQQKIRFIFAKKIVCHFQL
jgi:hypothetical protein